MDEFIAPGRYILTNMATGTVLDLSASDNVSNTEWYVHTCWPLSRISLLPRTNLWLAREGNGRVNQAWGIVAMASRAYMIQSGANGKFLTNPGNLFYIIYPRLDAYVLACLLVCG